MLPCLNQMKSRERENFKEGMTYKELPCIGNSGTKGRKVEASVSKTQLGMQLRPSNKDKQFYELGKAA